MRWLRISVLVLLTVGIVLGVAGGWSSAHPLGQVGYGAPQVLGEQFINPKHASSSSFGLWLGIFIALLILASTGFFGWRRLHTEDAP